MKSSLKFLPLLFLLFPVLVSAQYEPLVGIPGVGTDTTNFDQYLQAVYATSISLAALLAVIKIVIAGVKWMTTDIVSSKSAAKSDIQGAILGLVVILAAVLILYIINPNIGAVSLELTRPPAPATIVPTGGVVTPGTGGSPGDVTQVCEVNGTETCVAEREACERGDYFSDGRTGDASVQLSTTGGIIVCSPNETPEEALARQTHEAIERAETNCLAENNIGQARYWWDTSTNECKLLTTGRQYRDVPVWWISGYDISVETEDESEIVALDGACKDEFGNDYGFDSEANRCFTTGQAVQSDELAPNHLQVIYPQTTTTVAACGGAGQSACPSTVSDSININSNGSGVISSENMSVISVQTGETRESTFHRVTDEILSAGGTIIQTYDAQQFGGGLGSQERVEQNCINRGGSRISYLAQTGGVAYRAICSN